MSKTKKIIIGVVSVLAIALVGVGAAIWHEVTKKPVIEESTWIYIKGTEVDAPILTENQTVRMVLEAMHFEDKLQNGKLEGAYHLKKGMSALDVARKICHHQQDPVRLTFRATRLKEQLAGRFGEVLLRDSLEFLKAMTDPDFLSMTGKDAANVSAIFLPDTYEVYWDITPEKLMERMLKEYEKFWNDKRRSQADALGLTPGEITILASIAEEETADRKERGIVARLYWNRLNLGMLLQADPTVKYAIGDFGLKRILNRHLEVESPYNTYLNAGLPPGPIRIVEKATIDTILNSQPNDYLYMCAKPDFSGRHNFARNYQDHLRNAEAYHRALSNL